MPIVQNNDLAPIVTEILQETGVLPVRDKFLASLEVNGITIDALARILVGLLVSGKESTRLKALQMALSAYGIELQPKIESSQNVVVNINVQGNLQQNQLFSPERKLAL